MSSYRFARRPLWILSHVVLVAVVVLMVNLGFWQLRRLDDKRERNDVAKANEAQPTMPIEQVLQPTSTFEDGERLLYRTATATGTYDTANEVIIRSRSQSERPGVWVATPLRLDSGRAVVVVRGFLPASGPLDEVPADAAPPSGRVTVTGYLQGTQTRGRFGTTDPSDGRLTSMARVDVGRIGQQVPYPLYPTYLTLTGSDPAGPGPFPEPVPKLALDEGPHLSYAVQWFLFATIGVVGYPFILRRRARQGDRKDDANEGGEDFDREPLVASRT